MSAVWIVAELSGNHNGDLGRARALVAAAAEAGVDAVKLQTYTADTMTLDCDGPCFTIGPGSPWEGRRLHELYREAATPWEWHDELFAAGAEHGLEVFSTPFDHTAVEFLERYDPPAHKIASFELVDLPLISAAAATGRRLVMSTGMATVDEIDAAVRVAREAGAEDLVLLRCTSSYPAPLEEMDLRALPDMASRWNVDVGLSDHTLSEHVAVAAVALGAGMVEKHLTLARADGGPDASFSLEPSEFASLVRAIRDTEAALGEVRYGPRPHEEASLAFRRSLFVVADTAAGDVFDETNVRAIRPGDGLPPGDLPSVLGRRASRAIRRGTPLAWELVSEAASRTPGR